MILLNESEYAQTAISTRKLGNDPVETLKLVAKYYWAQGFTESQIEVKLQVFLVSCQPSVNLAQWERTLYHMAKNAGKYPLVDIASISVTRQELEIIATLVGTRRQRLAFTILCVAKYWNIIHPNNRDWVNTEFKELFKMANLSLSVNKQCLMINDLINAGLLKPSRSVSNNNIRVKFIDYGDDAVLEVRDFRNLGFQYEKFYGGAYIECSSCGLVVPKRSNNQKYCNRCAPENNREKTRKRKRKCG